MTSVIYSEPSYIASKRLFISSKLIPYKRDSNFAQQAILEFLDAKQRIFQKFRIYIEIKFCFSRKRSFSLQNYHEYLVWTFMLGIDYTNSVKCRKQTKRCCSKNQKLRIYLVTKHLLDYIVYLSLKELALFENELIFYCCHILVFRLLLPTEVLRRIHLCLFFRSEARINLRHKFN